jgi:hypothetical protein
MKNLDQIFQVDLFKLPYWINEKTGNFPEHYDGKASQYLKMLNELPDEAFYNYDRELYLNKAELIGSGISEVLSVYLNGMPSKAFILFRQLIQNVDLSSDLIYFRTKIIASNSKFYRVKKEYKADELLDRGHEDGINLKYDISELFHVPFHKRKAIGTNRFSIPGFPCLYLSESLTTSWSECIEKPNEAFHAIGYSNHRPLYIADISPFEFTTPEIVRHDGKDYLYQLDLNPNVLLGYGHLYLLVLACHSKVEYYFDYNGEVKFKSEYIIPQLLLQWFKENGVLVDGIRYLSCTAKQKFSETKLSPFNYVLPVQDLTETGHCSHLSHIFSKSPVYSCLKGLSQDTLIESLSTIQKTLSERARDFI